MIEQLMDPFTNLDQALLRVRSGDASELDDLVRQCYPAVFRFAISILDDPDDADDAAQEALIAAVGSLDRYRGESSFKTWLYAITLNTCRGYLRRRKARNTVMGALRLVMPTRSTLPTPEEATTHNESDRTLWAAVDGLDEKHRIVVLLRYAHDLPTKEIAQMLGVNEGTVHSRLHYAREKLMKQLRHTHGPKASGEAFL
jgi:RNA polymerase sigma-70 factor, ECF subfamily